MLLLVVIASPFAAAQSLYERPILIVDPGMHTAVIRGAAVDAAGRFIATGSHDKTLRIWSSSDGNLLRTIRVPAGPGNVGRIDAITISPDGNVVAAGGWTWTGGFVDNPIYLFDPNTGKMIKRITGNLSQVSLHLVFSSDGRYLAATLGGPNGLRVFDRETNWAEAFRNADYGSSSYGAAFADDGRLATASYDGKVRLYDRSFSLIASQEAPSGHRPYALAFSPDGDVLAVGYDDAPLMDLLDGHSLARLPGPGTDDLHNGNFLAVAWARDGQTLFAAGMYRGENGHPVVLAWDHTGRGQRRELSTCGVNTVLGLVPLPTGQLTVATGDPCLALAEPDGNARWAHGRAGADFRDQQSSLAVSEEGTVVDFGFEENGKSPVRFDLRTLTLFGNRSNDGVTRPPKQKGLSIESWQDSEQPKLNGKPIVLEQWETSRSLAIHPDNHRFALGTDWSLRAYDADGKALWNHAVPGETWAVNITGDGRLVVAAYHGGTIRWHRMDDGGELLALQVLGDRKNWVAWTPEGFYAATPGAYGVLRWQVNRGVDAAPETVPVSDIPRLNRPDALPFVLQELETARALGVADVAAARYDVQVATRAAKPPGARLQVLTIGISDYGDQAKQLHLRFADKDASDVANALVNTQGGEFNKLGGLYAEVLPIYLHDETASKRAIFEAFASAQRNMAKDNAGQDLAVVMFSGHGAIIDGQFYLFPYGVEAGTTAAIEASAIPAIQFQAEVKKLAEHGRVLVLLDACHSGAVARRLTTDGKRRYVAVGNVDEQRDGADVFQCQ